VLMAALTGAAAFGARGLSDIGALRQLGLLCAAGELLTAVAIVLITPEIGAWLERGLPPRARRPRLLSWAHALTATRPRAAVLGALALAPIGALALGFGPGLGDSIVALRPRGLEPLEVQQEIYDSFGGRAGQWVVLVADRDLDGARARADRLAEKLGGLGEDVESVDALTALAPAPSTQRARLQAREALDLPGKATQLEQALAESGFATERFHEALEGMRQPSRELVDLESLRRGPAAVLVSRYVGSDGADAVVALYVQPRDDEAARQRVESAVVETDSGAAITGYGRLEHTLRRTLRSDLPRIGCVAGLLVLLVLGAALRSTRDVLLAMGVVLCEIALVLLLVRWLGVPLHAYDVLVLPVLLGITVDEGMFLLFRARELPARTAGQGDALREILSQEGPLVAATALTTAAGFGALTLCRFDGLRHLGMVGALGSLCGLLVALIVVPAGLRLLPGRLAVPESPRLN